MAAVKSLMPNNSMVAMLMVLIRRSEDQQLNFTAEELDAASRDLRHLIYSEPFEAEDGTRMVRLTIIDRPGVELGLAGGRTQ